MSDKVLGVYVQLTESERGWGQRPDGYLISTDLDKLNARCKQYPIGDANSYVYADDPRPIKLSFRVAEEINMSSDGVIWVRNLKELNK
jgi:hypothetical protein